MDPVLLEAVTQGNLKLLEDKLTADPKSLLSKTPQQNTALHIAAFLGHRYIAERILRECETLVLQKNIDGDTPLHIASKFGKIKVADLLINYSVEWPNDIDSEERGPLTARNQLGNTALHEAVKYGKSEVSLRLLEAKPDVGHMLNERKESPLQIAARKGMAMVVKEILKQPWVETEEKTQTMDSTIGTPLHEAVIGGHIKIVEMLLRMRSDFVKQVDFDDNNALHYAAQKDNAKIVEMLIGKDPTLAYDSNYWGRPPLHVAVQYGSKSAIKAILKYCPDTEEQFGRDGGNALHVAVKEGKFGSLKCLLKLIKPEEIINHQDFNGNTPLHLAAMHPRIRSFLLLLRDRRVNPCLLNHEEQTARLVIEMHEFKANIYEMLVWRELKKQETKKLTQANQELLNIKLGADPKALLSRTRQQNTALHIAARLGHRHFAERILRECETLLVEKNIDGDTPLHIASKFGEIKVADLLIYYSLEWPIDIESEEDGPLTARNKLAPDFLTMLIRDYLAANVNANSAKAQLFCGYFTGSLYDITRVSTGNTALHEAVKHGKSEVSLRLLEAKPDVGHMLNERKESPLLIAARDGMEMVVKEILKIPWVETEEETQAAVSGSPLLQALACGHIKIVEMLLHQRSDFVKHVDSDGNNALHYAAPNDNEKIMEMLIAKDPSLAYVKNSTGEPPLHVAVKYDSKSAIKAILKHCPDTAKECGKDSGNALHVAVKERKFGSLKCLLKLIKPEEIINHQDIDGNTPLHLAAMHRRIQSSQLLLRDRRVNPCLLNKKERTARNVIEIFELNVNTHEIQVWRKLKKQEAKKCKIVLYR